MVNYFFNLNLYSQFSIIFTCGFILGMLLMSICIMFKNKKINIYQRKLEKESISSDENAAKVKVLEAKIKVLETALDNTLGNN